MNNNTLDIPCNGNGQSFGSSCDCYIHYFGSRCDVRVESDDIAYLSYRWCMGPAFWLLTLWTLYRGVGIIREKYIASHSTNGAMNMIGRRHWLLSDTKIPTSILLLVSNITYCVIYIDCFGMDGILSLPQLSILAAFSPMVTLIATSIIMRMFVGLQSTFDPRSASIIKWYDGMTLVGTGLNLLLMILRGLPGDKPGDSLIANNALLVILTQALQAIWCGGLIIIAHIYCQRHLVQILNGKLSHQQRATATQSEQSLRFMARSAAGVIITTLLLRLISILLGGGSRVFVYTIIVTWLLRILLWLCNWGLLWIFAGRANRRVANSLPGNPNPAMSPNTNLINNNNPVATPGGGGQTSPITNPSSGHLNHII